MIQDFVYRFLKDLEIKCPFKKIEQKYEKKKTFQNLDM